MYICIEGTGVVNSITAIKASRMKNDISMKLSKVSQVRVLRV